MATKSVCSIPGCGKYGVIRRGYCDKHYARWHAHGDPLVVFSRSGPGEAKRWLLETAVPHTDAGDCLIWPFGRNSKGYAQVLHNGSMKTAFRVLCEMVYGPAPSADHEAAHGCGNGTGGCVNPKHLRWATHKENAADRTLHGTQARGEKQGSAKLTEAQIREIRSLSGKLSQYKIAALFGIKQPQAFKILHRQQWAWLP